MNTTRSETITTAAAAAQAPARHRMMLLLLLVGQAMAAMDTSIVNVAAPALRSDLGISGALLQMVVAGYVFAYAMLLITGARLGDDYGYRRLFVIGAALFTGGSFVCGVAPGTETLVVARIVQGVGAALMVPQVLSLIQRHFEGEERARAVGYYSMILALGVTLGQILGGIIVTVDLFGLSWRPAFLVNVPIGLILLFYSGSVLPLTRGAVQRKLDMSGVAALSLSLLAIVVPLTFGHDVGWRAWVWVILGLGLVGLVGFVYLEKAVAGRGGAPLLDLGVFAPGVKSGLTVVFVGFAGYGGELFSIALYLQSGLGFTPLESGLVFTTKAVGFGIASLNWSRIPPRFLRWVPAVAVLVLTAAEVVFGVVAFRYGWVPQVMLPLLLITGIGLGLSFGPVVSQMASRVEPSHAPALSGLVTTAVQLAIVVGIATFGSIYLATATPGVAESVSHGIAFVTLGIAAVSLISLVCAVLLANAARSAPARA